ncbi:hypothetical protein G9F32_01730 [Acinetobacter sp. 194]|uniref:PilN domain-containing protein n=1 Tax=Acinetobacter shaoyimingii TaxID=2715164 RepID=UPI00140736F3|nr:PilN domain-containing protein [Acinetobacter shaoyimingii]NHB56760.1 hypothetical protein [Acinetobacter shaoyimingii]
MAKINLLPWREERREERKKQFILFCVLSAVLAGVIVVAAWLFFDHRLSDHDQANQLVSSTNQALDEQLRTLDGLEDQRKAVIDRMKLIQGLEGQRPVTVRLIDELVRVMPANAYVTKFTRDKDKFTIEGRAESPNAVAELLRNLEASEWYRNAFMNSFTAGADKKNAPQSSVMPRVEESYGTFFVTVDIGEIAMQDTDLADDKNKKNKGGSK